MSYFVTKEDLDRVVDNIFTALGRMFSEKDEELSKKMKELRNEFLLLIDTVGQQSHQLKAGSDPVIKRDEKKRKD